MTDELKINGPITDNKLREKVVKQYIPLLNKIAKQHVLKMPQEMEYDDILGYGYEGMVYAMNTYNSDRGLSFQQYLGWCIRNKILSGINEEGHTIKFSAYAQSQAKAGKSDYISTQSFSFFQNNNSDEDAGETDRLSCIVDTSKNVQEDKIWKIVCEFARKNFSEKDADMFIRFYGLDGKEPEEGKRLAARWGCSGCSVTVSKKKIIEAIKKSKELKDLLSDLL